jgi:MFS family permease
MSLDLSLLSLSMFVWGIGEGLFLIFQPIYLQQLGANTMAIASILSAYGAAMMVAHVPAGALSDRIGRKPLLIAAWGIGLIAALIMGFTRNLPWFTFGMLLYGLTSFVSSPMNAYVTAARGKLTPARAMTFNYAAYTIGGVIGPLAGGWVGERLGLRPVYFVASALFLLSTIIVTLIHSQERAAQDRGLISRNPLSNPRFVRFLGLAFLCMFALYLPQPLTSRFLQNEHGLSLSAIGLLGSVNGLGNALLSLGLGQLSAQVGLGLIQACVALFSLLIWRGSGLGWYEAGYFLLGGYRAARPFLLSVARGLIPPEQMGLAYGITETFNSLATALAPLLAGVVYTLNPDGVYLLAILLCGIMLIVSMGLGLLARRGPGGSIPPGQD